MLPYTTPEMRDLWSDEATIGLWLTVERTVAAQQIKAGINPHPNPGYSTVDARQWRKRVNAGEHEVTAFLAEWGYPGAHLGMTSSDLVDTAAALRLRSARSLLLDAGRSVLGQVSILAHDGAMIDRVARTHGQWAMLTKWADHWRGASNPMVRAVEEWPDHDLPYHLSGPIGVYSKWLPVRVADKVAEDLNLNTEEPTGTQAVSRDVYVRWAQHAAALATAAAQIARVVREGAASDANELTISRGVTSSAMPHKSNPTEAERIEGLAVLVNAQAGAMAQAVTWWGERDLVHSSIERVALPLICNLTHYSLTHLVDLLSRVKHNTDGTGEVRSRAAKSGDLSSFARRCQAQADGQSYLDAHAALNTKGSR